VLFGRCFLRHGASPYTKRMLEASEKISRRERF
jgi:hypothetical protein